jgi:hypothetical protein
MATAILLWLGHRATSAQERSDRLLADRRARETLALLIAALDRDMKGAQISVLLQLSRNQVVDVGAADLAAQASTAFGRFPYLETIFLWRDQVTDRDLPYVLNRADRPPPWDAGDDRPVAYPVVTRHGHPVILDLVDRIRADAPLGRRFGTYELALGGVPYQIVVQTLSDPGVSRPRLSGIVGYTVNLDWVRTHYFEEMVTQVSAIAGEGQSTTLSIADGAGAVVAATAAPSSRDPHTRRFPLAFFDSRLTDMVPAAPSVARAARKQRMSCASGRSGAKVNTQSSCSRISCASGPTSKSKCSGCLGQRRTRSS